MRAALIEDALVVNVIEYDPESDYEPKEGLQILELTDEPIGPGWRWINGEFHKPPVKTLIADPVEIQADNTSASIVTYTNTYDDAPIKVTFDVNGSTASIDLVDGIARLEVTATQPDEIILACDGLTTTITATEV